MAEKPKPGAVHLHRVLGLRDLVLLNLAAVVGLRWLSTAAQIGPGSLVLWILGLLLFFVPLGMSGLELSSRIPGEGGLYLWAKAAFGDAHGFIAGWIYWVSNLVFFPSMLLFGAGVFSHIAGERWLFLAGNEIAILIANYSIDKLRSAGRLTPQRIATLTALAALVVAVLAFDLDAGLTAITLAVVLSVFWPEASREAVGSITWPTVLLICGVLTYVSA